MLFRKERKIMNVIITFIKNWTLPLAIVVGAIGFQLIFSDRFANSGKAAEEEESTEAETSASEQKEEDTHGKT